MMMKGPPWTTGLLRMTKVYGMKFVLLIAVSHHVIQDTPGMSSVMKGSRRTTEGVGLADDPDLGRSTEVLLMYIVQNRTLNLFTCEWNIVVGVSEGSERMW